MADKTTGYIKLNKFTDNSYEEFMQAMESLQKQGLKSLILDLRGNGGGFMNEAVDMADEFLDGDKLVVFYSYECDLGDGWESPAVHHDPESVRTLALEMGANIISYVFDRKEEVVP